VANAVKLFFYNNKDVSCRFERVYEPAISIAQD
jgi:hypothetical protein